MHGPLLRGSSTKTEVDDQVIDQIATEGYDPDYGARHLQRNLEQLLLVPLARLDPGKLRAALDGNGEVIWRAGD